MSSALAVVYKLADGSPRELFLPAGAAVIQVPAGLLVMHEEAEVACIHSVRPLPPPREEEEDGPEGDGQREGDDPADLDEPGRGE